jgi:hypothetical protein
MAEAWQQIKSYAGILLTYSIRQSGIMVKINAVLIFVGETLKALAESMNAIEHFGGDVFESTTEGAVDAVKAIDEVKGKLLDFDKFRSLSSNSEENPLGLDEKLLNALSNFNTILGDASMKARELADNFKTASGLFNDDGTFNKDRWDELVNKIETFAQILASIVISNWLTKIAKGLTAIKLSSASLSNVLLTGAVFAFLKAIEAFREGDKVTGWLAIAIGVVLVGAFVALKYAVSDFGLSWKTIFLGITPHILGMVGGIAVLIAGIASLANAWGDMAGWHKAVTVIGAVGAAILGVWVAIKAFETSLPVALGMGAALAGGVMLLSSQFKTNVKDYANGGTVDKGTLFRAGEAGTEVVSNTNGTTEVTNVKQMEQAFYNALVRYGSSNNGKIEITLNLDGEKVYKNTTEHAKQHGYAWSKA